MSGSVATGKNAAITNKRLYGQDYYIRLGAIGGKAQVPKGFAKMDRAQHIDASRKGGTISRKGKNGK